MAENGFTQAEIEAELKRRRQLSIASGRRSSEDVSRGTLQSDPAQDARAVGLGMRAGLQGMGRNLGVPYTNIDVSHGLEALTGMKPYEQAQAEADAAGPLAGFSQFMTEVAPATVAGTQAVRGLQSLKQAPGILRSLGWGGTAARGAVEGAVASALIGQGDPIKDLGYGAAGGAIGAPIGRALGKIPGGFGQVSDDAANLLREGVPTTPGQAARDTLGGNVVRHLEEASTSIPVVGSYIAGLRGKGLTALRKRAVSEALPPGMLLPPKAGEQPLKALELVKQEFSKRYDKILKNIPKGSMVLASQSPDDVLRQTVPVNYADDVFQNAYTKEDYITKDRLQFVKNYIKRKLDMPGMSARQVFKVQSDLRQKARRIYEKTAKTAEEEAEADVYTRAADFVLNDLSNGIPEGKSLQILRRPYRNFVTLEREVSKLKGYGETLSPKGIQKAAMKAGNKPLEDVARAGGSVLPSQTPDSGTAGRIAAMSLLGAGGGYAQGQDLGSTLRGAALGGLAAGVPAAAFSTAPGMRFLTGGYPVQRGLGPMAADFGGILGGMYGPEKLPGILGGGR